MRATFIRDDGATFALTPSNGYQDSSSDDWLPSRSIRSSVYEMQGGNGTVMTAQGYSDWSISFNGLANRNTPQEVWAAQGRFYAFFALGHYYRLCFETCSGYITIPRVYITGAPTFTLSGKLERFANYSLTVSATDVFAYECSKAQLEQYDLIGGSSNYMAHYVQVPAYVPGQAGTPATPPHTETIKTKGNEYTSSGYGYGSNGYSYADATYNITVPGTPEIPAKPSQNESVEVFAPFGTIKSDAGSVSIATRLERNTAGTVYTIEPRVVAQVFSYPSGAVVNNLTTGKRFNLPTYTGSSQPTADHVELAIGMNRLQVTTPNNTGAVVLRWAGALLC